MPPEKIHLRVKQVHRAALAMRTAAGFLADIEMAKAADFSEAIGLSALLLKAPDQQHLMKYLHQGVAIFVDLRCRLFRPIKYAGAACWRVLGFGVALGRLAAHLVAA